MKPMTVSPNIVSLPEFKNTIFDILTEKVRFVESVGKGLSDVENGRLISDENLDKEL